MGSGVDAGPAGRSACPLPGVVCGGCLQVARSRPAAPLREELRSDVRPASPRVW